MRRAILFSILIISTGFLIFLIQRGGEIFKRETVEPNLGGFYRLTRQDPLFYSPFFNQEEFKSAIQGLKEKENQLKEVIIANLEKTTGFEKDYYIPFLKEKWLFPYQFLENLILINQKTEEFLKNPSIEKGENLLNLYDQAADSYIQNISSKIQVLEEIEKHKKPLQYFFFVDSVSSFEVIKNDFLTIRENGYQLKEEVKKRRNCLLGKENCQALIKPKDNSSFINLLSESGNFNLKGEKIDFIKSILSLRPGEIKGPYKIKSFCWQNPNFEHWMYLIYYQENGKIMVLPKLVNQNYYFPIPSKSQNVFYQVLSKKGIKFIFQPEASTYECPDLTFYPQLLTLDFLKEKIEKGLITTEDLEKNLDYKLLIENQFGLLTPTINALSFYLNVLDLLYTLNESSASLPLEYIFSARTAYSIFYFPFAKSIWRIDKELKYFLPEEKKPSTASIYKTLDDLKEMGYSEREIRKFHGLYEELPNIAGHNY